MGIKTHCGPIDSVRRRKSIYSWYSYRRNQIQNAMRYNIWEILLLGSMGTGLGFCTQLWTPSFLLWFSAFPCRHIPENPKNRGEFPFQEPQRLTFSGRICGCQKGLSNFMYESRRPRRKENPVQEHERGKLCTLREKWVRIRNPISAGCVCSQVGTGTEYGFAGGRGGKRPPVRTQSDLAGMGCQGWNSLSSVWCPPEKYWNVSEASLAGWLSPRFGGCTGGAWGYCLALRSCLQPSLARTTLAPICWPKHPKEIPWQLCPMAAMPHGHSQLAPLPGTICVCVRQK